MVFTRGLWCLAAVCTLATQLTSMSRAEAPGPDLPAVELRKGASLREALEELSRTTHLPAFAEPPSHDAVTAVSFSGPMPDALKLVATTWDLQPLMRSDRITFVRGYSDPEDTVDLTLAELRSAATDLQRLFHPFSPRIPGIQDTRDHDAFVASLTPQQLQIMQTGGLPVTALRLEQKQLWSLINACQAYANTDLSLSRVARICNRWSECSLVSMDMANGERLWGLRFPDPTSPGGWGRQFVRGMGNSTSAGRVVASWTSRHPLLVPEPPHSQLGTFDKDIALPSGESAIPELIQATGKSLGTRVAVAGYTRSRKLLIAAHDLRTPLLAQVFAETHGWDLRSERTDGQQQLVLARPRVTPAVDPFELHAKQMILLPQPLRTLLSRREIINTQWAQRQMLKIAKGASINGEGHGFPVSRLTPDEQDIVAQVIAVELLRGITNSTLSESPMAPYWMLTPERGTLIWDPGGRSVPAPGGGQSVSSAQIRFMVVRPDGGHDSWGWAPGTSTEAQARKNGGG